MSLCMRQSGFSPKTVLFQHTRMYTKTSLTQITIWPQYYYPPILTHMYFTSCLSDLIWVTKSPLEAMKNLTSFQPTLNQKSSDSMGILLLPNPFSWHCRSCFCLSPPNCVCVYLAWLHQASATCVGKGIFGQMVRKKSRTVIARSNLCSNP